MGIESTNPMVNPTLQEALWNLLCLQTVSLEKIMRILCVYDGLSLVVHKKNDLLLFVVIFHLSGQIIIIHKPELRPFGDDFPY